jgi:hypothetical protein
MNSKSDGGRIMDKATKVAVEKYPHGKFDGELGDAMRAACAIGYMQAERDLGWHSVKEMLPPIDEEVIVLTDNIHGKIVPGSHMICYAHRPNPKGWDGENIETGEVKHYDVVTYDGWNIPGVTHWMHCPKLEEE